MHVTSIDDLVSLQIRMKMKFSIFLCLLPFTLSVPPPTFPHHNVQPDCSPLEPTSPLFKIARFGIHIWKIPNLERNEVESSHSSAGSGKHNENYLSNKLSIYWPKEPVLVKWVQLSQLNEINMKLFTEEAYILLKVNEDKTCQLSYWVGNNSNLSKRRITARFVVRLMHDLQTQINEANLNFISREQQYRESAEFQLIFNLGNGNLRPRLYKLTGRNNDLIKAVPLSYSELNGIDTFVLDETTHIKIWSASLNIRKKRTALALANYINNADRLEVTRTYKFQIGNELNHRDFLTFQQEFLQYLKDNPSPFQFPVYSLNDTNEQVREERNLQLFKYCIYENRVYSQEIVERPLKLKHFQTDKTYIMIDYNVDHLFIIIGLYGHTAMIEDAMADAELFYWKSLKLRWKKITIIRSTDQYPTPFIINFNEFKSILNNYYFMK